MADASRADGARWPARPWYRSPEWIVATITVLGTIVGGATAIANSDAQTATNTRDILELKQQGAAVPDRLARIEQKVDDMSENVRLIRQSETVARRER